MAKPTFIDYKHHPEFGRGYVQRPLPIEKLARQHVYYGIYVSFPQDAKWVYLLTYRREEGRTENAFRVAQFDRDLPQRIRHAFINFLDLLNGGVVFPRTPSDRFKLSGKFSITYDGIRFLSIPKNIPEDARISIRLALLKLCNTYTRHILR